MPTAWLAESRAWVERANTAVLEAGGNQDIFLAGGQYRAQPVVLSPLVWAIWEDVFSALAAGSGTQGLSWNELHDAAVTGDLGLLIGDPKGDPAGITSLVNAAEIFLDFLLFRQQQSLLLEHGFRPADVNAPLGPPIDPLYGADPEANLEIVEVPGTQVINAIVELWECVRLGDCPR